MSDSAPSQVRRYLADLAEPARMAGAPPCADAVTCSISHVLDVVAHPAGVERLQRASGVRAGGLAAAARRGFDIVALAQPTPEFYVEEVHWPKLSRSLFKLDRVRPSVVAYGIAECQVRFPTVPIVFCETRKLAQEWTYRFLAASRVGHCEEVIGDLAVRSLHPAPVLAPAPPTPADVRRWAARVDIVVSDRGRIPTAVMDQYLEARARGEV